MPWLYTLARKVFRRGVDFYFLDMQVEGAEHVAERGPLLVASNHPNSVLDALVLGTVIRRPIGFLARSGLFKGLVGPLLRAGGAIPIFRRQDGPAKPGGNQDAFRAAYDVLEDGGVIGIFPEGRNAPERHVRDIKTGVARIALGAEAAHGWKLGVHVLPIGLNYEERDRFLARVLIRIGPPIAAADYRDAYEDDAFGAARAMTDELQRRMREQAVHVHREEHTDLLHAIDALVGTELQQELVGDVDLRTFDEKLLQRVSGRGGARRDLEGRRQVRQWIADAIDHYERDAPERLENLRRGLERYEQHLRQLRLRHDFAERSTKGVSRRREAIRATLYAILLAPIAFWGLFHNFIPYRFTRRFALAAPEEAIRSIRAVTGGALFFGLMYTFFGVSTHAAGAPPLGLALYLLSMPLAGVWFMRYRQRLGQFAERQLVRTLFQSRRALFRRLLLEREALLIQIDGLRRDYETLRRAELESE